MKLADFPIEHIIEHVASWPTSDEEPEAANIAPDLIDDWIKLARRLRTRDRRAAMRIIHPVAV